MKKALLSILVVIAIILLIYINFFLKRSHNHTPETLTVIEETLKVNGRPKKVFNIIGPDGKEGYVGTKGRDFNVRLINKTSVPISIHWHGLVLPNDQDGVPYVTQLPIQPGRSRLYQYPLLQAGTFWMHSHYKFHEQNLMAAPMIIKDPQAGNFAATDVVVLFHDFTFKNPKKIFAELRKPKKMHMQHGEHGHMDLNDVKYDALLANRRTLRDPQVFYVKPNEKVRLRLINGASASNLWVDTGKLEGVAIAVDGNDIHPIKGNEFQLAVAQRMDVEVTMPEAGGAFPILAQIEGTKMQTGVILATKNAVLPKLSEEANTTAPALNDKQDFELHALMPLEDREPDTSLLFNLTGDMKDYVWEINGQAWPLIKPYKIKDGDRVQMVFTNDTDMAHPMHLHGHVFQVTEVNGKPLTNGPMRDTILVLPHTTQKIVFDADNPGIWMTHCHVLYHMAAGMMTTTNYADYPEPKFYQDLISGKIKE